MSNQLPEHCSLNPEQRSRIRKPSAVIVGLAAAAVTLSGCGLSVELISPAGSNSGNVHVATASGKQAKRSLVTSKSRAQTPSSAMTGSSSSASPINIMPLGDSITSGNQSRDGSGWRTYIASDLIKAGYNARLVGARQDGTAVNIGSDSGYPGYVCSQLTNLIGGQIAVYHPNIVILDCGANDLETGSNANQVVSNISTVVNTVETDSPSTYVILANLTPINIGSGNNQPAEYSADNQLAEQINSMLPSVVTTRQAEGKPISLVNMYGSMNMMNASGEFVDINNLSDHPDDAGYSEMAQLLWPALTKAIASVAGHN